MVTFGQRLRELRNRRGLSQRELAEIIGVSKSSANMYERDEREPSFRTLGAIADFFGVSMDYLLGRADEAGAPHAVQPPAMIGAGTAHQSRPRWDGSEGSETMARPRKSTSSTQDPIAMRLRELIANTRDLAGHLGVLPQSVNSWKTGQTRPSLENLCEISRFYGVTTDYILGLTDVKHLENRDKRVICDATGLSEEVVDLLMADHSSTNPSHLAFLVGAFLTAVTAQKME